MKKSQTEKAIENLESQRNILDLAIQKLREQLTTSAAKRPRTPKPRVVASQERAS